MNAEEIKKSQKGRSQREDPLTLLTSLTDPEPPETELKNKRSELRLGLSSKKQSVQFKFSRENNLLMQRK